MMRAIVVLLGFLALQASRLFLGSWNPNPPFVLFNPQNGHCHSPETLCFKGKMPNFGSEMKKKLGP